MKNGYFYYPGCSLKGTGKSYDKSLLCTFEFLDYKIEELPDWNCCGATSYMAIDEISAFAMSARNLAIAESGGKDIIAPCAACYMILNKAKNYMEEYPDIKNKITKAFEKSGQKEIYKGKVNIKHPLDIFINEIGLKEISFKIQKPLKGLRVFSYYGCLLVRPFCTFDDPRFPTSLDKLMNVVGAETITHALKTKCCGGALTGTIEEVGLRLSYLILKEAKRKGAHVIVTVCPLCQFNLEAYQSKMEKVYNEKLSMPILYFTQILGAAFGISEKKLGLSHHLIFPDILFAKAAV